MSFSWCKTKKKKVKCTLVQALRICTGRTAHRGSIALLFLDHGTRRGWGVSVTPRPLFTPGKDPVPTVQEAGWAPGPVWTGAENLVPTGIRSRTVQPVASRYTDWATLSSCKKVKVKWSRYRPGVAQRVGRGIALLFHDRGTRRRWVVSSTARPHFTPWKDPVPTLQEASWVKGPVWTGAENLAPHRDSIPGPSST